MPAEKKFDLRELYPLEGHLVLLVDNDPEGGESPLLLVFDRFLEKISDSREIGVTLLRHPESACHLDAKEAIYLAPQTPFCEHRFNFPGTENVGKSKIKYRPDEGYVGEQDIISALRKMKGYDSYADLLSAQAEPRH